MLVLLAICKPCIRFRWSLYRFRPKSTPISSGALGFPSWGLIQSFPSGARISIAFHIPHIMPCFASCGLRIAPWLSVVSFACVLALGRAGRRVRDWGTCWVRSRGSSFHQLWELCKQDDHFASKMTIPSKSLLSLLASCSLYCYAAIPNTCYIMPPILPCQASNPPFPRKPLFGYVTALLSPSYSVASCRWRLETVPCWNIIYLLGYHYIILLS